MKHYTVYSLSAWAELTEERWKLACAFASVRVYLETPSYTTHSHYNTHTRKHTHTQGWTVTELCSTLSE